MLSQLRYDARSNPCEALNDLAVLDDTPIGRLRVMVVGRRIAVVRVDDHDETMVMEVVHFLRSGDNPLDAIYGKRMWERAVVRDAYLVRDDSRAASDARNDADESRDTAKMFADYARIRDSKTGDGTDALQHMLVTGRLPNAPV